ncbi:MAG: tetratricopeptide repeat protein, partial [Bacteroidales bacterium]|nr:tetratricopeptide repeat protein [Bacteroidales bacterium]
LVLLSSGQINAQEDPEIDSLTTLLGTLQGEERLEILFLFTENPSFSIDDRQDYAKDAISLASDLSNTELLVEAHIKNGFIFYEIDEFDDAIESFETAYAISEESNYAKGRANALNRIGGVNRWIGNYDIALDYFNRSLEIGKEAKDPQIGAEALYLIADIKRRNAQYAEAIEYLDRARPVAEVSNNRELLPDIIGSTGLVMYLQGNFQDAINNYEEAAELYNQVGAMYDAGLMYLRLGNANLQRAEYDVALNFLQQALHIFEELNSAAGIDAVTNAMGVIYFTQKLYDRALELHFNRLERVRELGDKMEIAKTLNNIGNTYNILADDSLKSLFGVNYQDSIKFENTDKYLIMFDEALRYYSEALEVREELEDINGIANSLYSISIIYINSGKPAMALEPLERALELNTELNNISSQAMIYLLLGEVYLAFENYNTALDYLNNALELALEADIKEIIIEIYSRLSE